MTPYDRAALLAAALPISVRRVSIWPDGTRRPCVYRYATTQARDQHLEEEARALRERGA